SSSAPFTLRRALRRARACLRFAPGCRARNTLGEMINGTEAAEDRCRLSRRRRIAGAGNGDFTEVRTGTGACASAAARLGVAGAGGPRLSLVSRRIDVTACAHSFLAAQP